MIREQRIQRYAVGWFWKQNLQPALLKNNLKYEEIVLVEELNYLFDYSGVIRVTNHSNNTGYMQISVMFDKRGIPVTLLDPQIYKSLDDVTEGGKIIFNL
jgi:hypothetical protein